MSLGEGTYGVRESVGTRVVGMRCLISYMTHNIPYRIALFIWNIKLDVLCTPLHVHFRWGVALVGEFSTGYCSPCLGTPFQVQRVYGETTLLQGRNCEGSQHVTLSNIFVKVFCIKEFYKNYFGLLYK